MRNIEKFLNDTRNQEGIKGRIKRFIFRSVLAGFEAVKLDIKDNAELTENCRLRIETLESKINAMAEENIRFHREAEELNVILAQSKALNARLDAVDASASHSSELLKAYRTDLENLSINVHNNNSIIESLKSDAELAKTKISGLKREIKNIPAVSYSAEEKKNEALDGREMLKDIGSERSSDYEEIDYFDFENHFRGSIESIKKSQRMYLKYFAGKSHVIDIGCGRGEFLSLLKENGIEAEGADIYEPYVDYCQMNGLKAVCCDGAEYLASVEKADGIFVGQVVEHLEPYQIIRLCNTAYEKLTEGGCIVIETPNPTSLAIYTNAFYIDPSHVKPVHPLTMKYYLEKAGFKNIEIVYTESSRPDQRIPELKCESAENAGEFNAAMKKVSDIIFGSQDYAIIAVR